MTSSRDEGVAKTLMDGSPTPPKAPAGFPTIDRALYVVDRELARGGMGRIFLARDRRLDRTVAVKEVLVTEEMFLARFDREVQLTARLQHPGIVSVYEAGCWPSGEPFYAMRLVAGRPFSDVIAATRTLADRLALLPHVLAVAEALAYAHAERIIHRDLKPANVLVGTFGETVVIDWGLAKDLDDATPDVDAKYRDGGDGALTMLGSVMGTPSYMPIEQAAGEPVDERADVYAIGAILYELLCGAPPYEGPSGLAILGHLLEGPPVALRLRAATVPADLIAIVERAMARDAPDRYRSAKELADDLRRFQTGQLVATHAYSMRELVRRWIRKHRAQLAIGTLALIVLVAGGVWSYLAVSDQRDRAETSARVADAARGRAETAEAGAIARADELAITQARATLETDPTASIRALASVSTSAAGWGAVRIIAGDARAKTIATHVAQIGEGAEVIGISRDGKRVTLGDRRATYVWTLASGAMIQFPRADFAAAAVSSDGEHLAIYTGEGAEVWTVSTHTARTIKFARTGDVQLAFTADARALVVATDEVTLWPLDGAPPTTLALTVPGRALAAFTLAQSADGSTIAVASGGAIRACRFAGACTTIAVGSVGALALTSDGARLIFAAGAAYGIADTATGVAQGLVTHEGELSALALGPDDRVFAAADTAGTIAIWDLAKHAGTRWDPGGAVRALRFAGADTLVATSGKQVGVLELAGDARMLAGHADVVTGIAASADHTIVSASEDGLIEVWAPDAPLPVACDRDPENLVSRDRRVAVTVHPGTVRTCDVRTGAARDVVLQPALAFDAGAVAAVSADGETLAIAWNGKLFAIALATGAVRALGDANTPPLSDPHHSDGRPGSEVVLAFQPDGQLFAADVHTVTLWDVAHNTSHLAWRSETQHAATPAPDGRHVLDAPQDAGEPAVIRDLTSGKTVSLGTIPTFAAFSPDSRQLAGVMVSANLQVTLRIWNVETGVARELTGPVDSTLQGLRWSPDGATIAVQTDAALRIFTVATGQDRAVLNENGAGGLSAVAYCADGHRLVALTADGAVVLVDAVTAARRIAGRLETGVRGHVACSPDGNFVVASGDGATTRSFRDDLPSDPAALHAWLVHANAPIVTAP